MKTSSNSRFASTTPRNRQPASIATRRWVAYAAAAASTTLIESNSAEAAIHYSGLINKQFRGGCCFSSRSFALDQPGDHFALVRRTHVGLWIDQFRIYGIQSAAWNRSKPASLALTATPAFSSGSNSACDACELDGPGSSTAGQRSSKFGNTGSYRSSRTGTLGNRIRLLRRRLKPERQLVLPAPEPVRLPLTEVKEVFS